MIAAPESYTAALPELKELYPRHWAELASDLRIPLSPRYDVYQNSDALGLVAFIALRHDAKLVGYFLGFVTPALHYSTSLTCTTDIFYVLPEYRNGFAGLRLFRATERELRRLGVNRWYASSKIHKDSSALLRRMGFSAIDVGYSKRLI